MAPLSENSDINASSTRQISVSRDALRADLGELELRMKEYIKSELDRKASAEVVDRIGREVDMLGKQAVRRDERTVKSWESFENGNMTPNQVLAIQKVAEQAYQARAKEGWSRRERFMGLVTLAITIAALGFTSVYTINAIQHNPIQPASTAPPGK